MDSVVHSALEEICCEAADGLHLRNLWQKLTSSLDSGGLSISPSVKRAVWENIVEVPGLKFEPCDDAVSCNSTEDWSKCTVEECEKRNVKIVAPEAMWKSFLGIYEIEALESSLSDTQRFILQKLTVARTNGIAQSELAKDLRMAPNNLFYPLKRLETLGLIVRLPTIIRKKQASKGREPNSDSTVQTNMLYLYRFGKHLDCQQRLEISKEDKILMDREVGDGHSQSGDDFTEEIQKEDVHVKDFLPALKDICDKLEKADGKVLVVSDIKRDLGYRGASGHRAWRQICHRLKDAQVIEDCCTMVNKKMVKCLRLLKSFSPSHFEPKFHGRKHNDINLNQSISSVKRGQTTELLVELPVLRQIYDMIDAAGSKGLTNTEVCRGLGLCNKEYHKRYYNRRIFRFGLHLKREIHNRCEIYRLFTASNFNLKSSNMSPDERKTVPQEVSEPNSDVLDLDFHENLSQPMPMQVVDTSTSMGNVVGINESENHALILTEASNGKSVDDEGKSSMLLQWNPRNSDSELSNEVPDEELLLLNKSVIDKDQLEKSPPVVVTPPRRRSYLRYPCLTMVATSSQREQQILKMLQEDKFLIKPELHRRLESLEREKNTLMDRKTLDHSLEKLQKEEHCICIDVSVPVVTNCGRSRTTLVVLHPSVSITEELMKQIHDKMRNFDIQVRRQSCTRQTRGQSVTILDNVQRIRNSVRLDVQSERAEVMRANGFVPAKMVRAKLLHIYLWGWVSSSPGRDDALLSNHASELNSPHSNCKLFELDVAIKSMPFELFLQVVGSAQKFEDMAEKCSSGLRLSDLLSIPEYSCLMDTRASGRLSWLIDILLRLKLIRLVSKGSGEDRTSSSHTTLTHALELKPYIEEPVSSVASCGFLSPDLRPNRRYDFVLRNRKIVDDYWDTLEYCYATAKPKAALHAFPGSTVHEVFHSLSWTSVRLMTTGQRAELLQRVGKDDPNKKLSFSECEKIAKDLNLTLEQVLRVYYDKRQKRLTRFQRDAEGEKIRPTNVKHILSPRKRKRDLAGGSSKLLEAHAEHEQSSVEAIGSLLDPAKQLNEEQVSLLTTSEDYECQLQGCYTGDEKEDSEKPESNEEEKEASTLIHRSLSRLNPARQRRFLWTEEADRTLVIAYARHRAENGAKFNRVNWASISNLPAHPHACRRRMSSLKSCKTTRKEIMKLCEKLACRYKKYLEIQDKMLNRVVGSKKIVQDITSDGDSTPSIPESWKWDDFDDNDIKAALDDVLRYKRMANLEIVKDDFSDQENEDFEDCGGSKASSRKSSSRKLPTEYVKLLNGGARVGKRMHESVPIANATELFKLIFLSSSTAPEVSTVLAKTLRRYSEHDLYSAFNYLREKKIMIGGSCNNRFELSHQFLQNISPPEFPKGTGERSAMFASWVHEREKNLMEEGVEVPSDLQFGETFTLCALLTSGELSITPSLPEEGVGEAEDNRTSKRKYDCREPDGGGTYKKFKTSFAGESEISSRRPKGFPGIKICLHRETMSRILAINSFVDGDIHPTVNFGVKNRRNTSSGLNVGCDSSHTVVAEHVREILDSEGSIHPVLNMSGSPWEAMTRYAEYLVSSCSYEVKSSFLHPSLMKTLYSAIHKSGDRGLSMKEISKVLNIEDENMLEIMVEVLETFGQALKVNAYNSIHLVDSLYRSKYCLTSVPDSAVTSLKGQNTKSEDEFMPVNLDSHIDNDASSENQSDIIADEMHRVTILNLPEDVTDPPDVISEKKITGYKLSEVAPSNMNREVENFELHSVDTQTCRPLLPWMNGDGTVNELVYQRLRSCVLRIVMQNPGILEDGVIEKMRCLNPQSCRRLLEIMIMDNHIITRKMQQMTSTQPPSILGNLLGNCFKKSRLICRVHLYANPMSTSFL
ncbi:hypothetical protein ACJIZ3_020516 [Penstemon smallii]|uniref:B-block binding subunit of TFIIIC domain-containing protein n=1 Tax=Penstemon smallii TaxID=265156 RepID=A0ABD3SJ22_9LAMI